MDYQPLPGLTHLQVLICWALRSPYWEGLTARDLLAVLHRHQSTLSESAFYQLMQRMETAGFVVCEVDAERRRKPGNRLLTRRYRLTIPGQQELHRTQEFYRTHMEHPRRFFCSEFGVSLLTEDDWNGDRASKPTPDATSNP